MATINCGTPQQGEIIDSLQYDIHDPQEFWEETFGLPEGQKLPTDHYEVRLFLIIGTIGSGKTIMAKEYFGDRIFQLWGDTVDFFEAKDLWGTIEAVKNSEKLFHYVIIDDSIPKFDSRRSMSRENLNATQMYYTIRHELKKHAEENEGNAGGLVIIAIITQDFGAIDKRLREACAFYVFKTYDPICKKLIEDEEIISLLLTLKDKSVRSVNYNYRVFGVGVDCKGKYALFSVFRDELEKVHFKKITSENRFIKQRNHLIKHLVENVDLGLPKSVKRGMLFSEMDKIRESGERLMLTKAQFSEIFDRADKICYEEGKESGVNTTLLSEDDLGIKILLLHDVYSKSFETIELEHKIPHSTANRLYHKTKEKIEKGLLSLEEKSNEIQTTLI